jgi:hypothetical protein
VNSLQGVVPGPPDCTCAAAPGALHTATCMVVAAANPHTMIDDAGAVYYPDSLADAVLFAEFHGARFLDEAAARSHFANGAPTAVQPPPPDGDQQPLTAPPKGMGLRCRHCRHVFPAGVTIGVVHAHIKVEHSRDQIELELVPLCRCGRGMDYLRSSGSRDHFWCEPCRRSRVLSRDRPSLGQQ